MLQAPINVTARMQTAISIRVDWKYPEGADTPAAQRVEWSRAADFAEHSSSPSTLGGAILTYIIPAQRRTGRPMYVRVIAIGPPAPPPPQELTSDTAELLF